MILKIPAFENIWIKPRFEKPFAKINQVRFDDILMEDLKLISATEAVEDFCFYINSVKLT